MIQKIDRLITALNKEVEFSAEDIADTIWLAMQMERSNSLAIDLGDRSETKEISGFPETDKDFTHITPPQKNSSEATENSQNQKSDRAQAGIYHRDRDTTGQDSELSIKVPDAPALREPLTLAKAFKPLMRHVPSGAQWVLDEAATIQRIADEKLWLPVLKPTLEPWLDLEVVVDEGISMHIWRRTIQELERLLKNYGIFRDVRVWGLVAHEPQDGSAKITVQIRRGLGRTAKNQSPRSPKELIDPSGRRLVLVVSDCVSALWRDREVNAALGIWSDRMPTAIVQMLPKWLWKRSALGNASEVLLRGLSPGVANQYLIAKQVSFWDDSDPDTGIKVPIFTLEGDRVKTWAQMLSGQGNVCTEGYVFPLDPICRVSKRVPTLPVESVRQSAEKRVRMFRSTASPMARKLAGLLAAAPVITLPVVRLIRETLLRDSLQVNVAEVFLGGLLKPLSDIRPETNPDSVEYGFMDGVRELLLDSVPTDKVLDTVKAVSEYIARKVGLSLAEFNAVLLDPQQVQNRALVKQVRPFAMVTAQILRELGGEYAKFAETLDPNVVTFEFDVATLEYQPPSKGSKGDPGARWTIRKQKQQISGIIEDLGNGIQLELAKILPGKFLMGSPTTELDRFKHEDPQHEVNVSAFLMGRYPITQAQWKAVVTQVPKIFRDLDSDPSYFKDDNRPVECVSWYDCIEFCARISKYTGRHCRLPSEAEWEYACRAGTTTPFHFGETITTDLANYNGNVTYGNGPKGQYRAETTSVGSFGVANAFGLYDMHGNVWEWCLDDWHQNYNSAPSDGRPWLDDYDNDHHLDKDWILCLKKMFTHKNNKLLHGGDWYYDPRYCRSARRYNFSPGFRNYYVGFRFAVSLPRT